MVLPVMAYYAKPDSRKQQSCHYYKKRTGGKYWHIIIVGIATTGGAKQVK
jgi:hypothetical protein